MNRFIIVDAMKCIGCCICEVVCVVLYYENQDCVVLLLDEFIFCICVIKDYCWITVVVCYQCEDVLCVNVCFVDAISCEYGYIFVE